MWGREGPVVEVEDPAEGVLPLEIVPVGVGVDVDWNALEEGGEDGKVPEEGGVWWAGLWRVGRLVIIIVE